jgi:hypothetical protein
VSKYFLGRNLGNLYEKVGELTNWARELRQVKDKFMIF